MLLAVDVGNSHTVSGIFSGGLLIAEWRLKSDRDRTGDELAIRYHSLFQMADIRSAEVTGFIISSVVPTLTAAWSSYVDRYFAEQLAAPPLTVSNAIETGITIATDNPAEVGADRIVNAVAACSLFTTGPLIVVDFGTAITFDCINGDRQYLGGAILPGIPISLDALASRTAKLPRVEIDQVPEKAVGRNTGDAIRSGVLIGFGGMVDRLVDRLAAELCPAGEPVKVIATGGMAHIIAPHSTCIQIIEPRLTLNGLRIIYEKNSTNGS
ncbi:type III pantothenate kinase [bacterium BMS3Abin13]|nr:type III pantothenate kinase [bacterium BMS3Abin13]